MNEEKCVMCGKSIPEGSMVCYDCENAEPSFETTKIVIAFEKIAEVSAFVNLASKCVGDVIVKSGNYSVNGKSVMGLFSLDLTKQLEVEFYGNIPYEVREGMKKFIVD